MKEGNHYIYTFEEGGKEMAAILGGKGAGLAEMKKIGLNVPDGFIITTKACIAYQKGNRLPDGLNDLVRENMKVLETKTKKGFGSDKNPLLVSVRSGAPVSMPGMMDTMDIKEFFIGGNSYGGWVALSYEVKYADSQGLILIDNAGTNPTVGDQGEESVEKFMSRIERVSPKNDMKIMRQIVENNTGSKYKIDAEKLRKIGKRSLIIWGKEDQMIPVEYGIRANENMQNSKLVIIENGTHTPHVSSNEKVCGSIVDYLNGK